jgi:diguanylate cyclase (GGDEF)-like protein/PAS domain S-box-containing protein
LLASFGIILLAFAGVALDIRDRRRSEMEVDRMRGLANAAVEGLLVCEGETIVSVNNSFAALTGSNIEEIVGAKLDRYFPDEVNRLRLLGHPTEPVEGELLLADGSATPVELILHPVDFAGKPHHAIAVRDLRARKQAEQKIRFLAHHDVLTGLPNRGSFDKRLDQEIEAALVSGRRLAVLCLDLDRFKEVNDLFGHAAGDALLQTVANCVMDMLDPSHMMARLGGDEFAIIVPALSNPIVAGRIAEDILEGLRALSEGSASGALVSSSIGIAIYPNDATDRQALLTHADTALYRADGWPRHISLL